MAIDMAKMRKRYEEDQKSGDFLSFEKGQTLVYIHPQCRPEDEWEPTANLPFVPVAVHYGLGSSGKQMAVSLDGEANPIIDHPYVKGFLKKAKKRITGGCPVAAALRDGTIEEDAADESRRQSRYLWGMTPMKHRAKSSAPWTDLSGKPSVAFIGKQIHSGIMDLFMEHDDITDPSAAILVRIERTGDSRNTKYKVTVESSTLKTAFALPKAMKSALAKAMAEGGDCDLFRIVSSLVKPTAEVQAMVDGVSVETDPDENDDEEEKPKKPKKSKPAPEPEEDEDEDEPEDDEPEDDEEEPPPKKPKKPAADDDEEEPPPKKPKKPAPEPEEDDDEDDDEEDDEPPAKPAKSKKPAPEPDEDEEPPAKKPKDKSAKSDKPKKPAADDDDEEDLSDMEAALSDLEPDADDEKPKKPKKSKTAPEPEEEDEDEDEDEDDDEEDDEPPPPKKKAKK